MLAAAVSCRAGRQCDCASRESAAGGAGVQRWTERCRLRTAAAQGRRRLARCSPSRGGSPHTRPAGRLHHTALHCAELRHWRWHWPRDHPASRRGDCLEVPEPQLEGQGSERRTRSTVTVSRSDLGQRVVCSGVGRRDTIVSVSPGRTAGGLFRSDAAETASRRRHGAGLACLRPHSSRPDRPTDCPCRGQTTEP